MQTNPTASAAWRQPTNLVGQTLAVCAFAMAAAGAYLNYQGAQFMIPGEAGKIAALAAVVAELVKVFWLTALALALASYRFGAALAVAVLGVTLHAFSLTCAIGVTASERAAVMDVKGDMQDRKARAEMALGEAQARVKELGSKATNVRDELRIAGEIARAKADVRQAQKDLDALTAPSSRDPQAEALATFLPIPAPAISKAMPLLPSLVVEFALTLTLLMAGLFGTQRSRGTLVEAPHATIDAVRTSSMNVKAAAKVMAAHRRHKALGGPVLPPAAEMASKPRRRTKATA